MSLKEVANLKKPRLPDHFARNASDAIAVLKDGIIVYATNSFEKLYNPLRSDDRETFRRALCNLNRDIQRSRDGFIQKQVALIPGEKEINITVYLLNKPGSMENRLLVLADPKEPGAEMPYSMPDQPRDADQIPPKAAKKKLS
jgi:hypothetical protein